MTGAAPRERNGGDGPMAGSGMRRGIHGGPARAEALVASGAPVEVHPRVRARLEQTVRERKAMLDAAKRDAAVRICDAIARLCGGSSEPDPARLALIAELMHGLYLCLGDPGKQGPIDLAQGRADWSEAKRRIEAALARDRGAKASCSSC